ncbi:MAG: Glycosyl transferase family protein [Nitrosopumilales archaeon]|nr:MAG: Glycosyl transferase family protein [Nitrosopumilales archaeon]
MPDWKQVSRDNTQVSIIIPTYNESLNILKILKSIGDSLPKNIISEAIVVDDNSPDGTGKIVEDYLKNLKKATAYSIDVIHRKTKMGLSSAILNGIQRAKGDTIVVMDGDFSHPPQIIPKMLHALNTYKCDIVVASRYVKGGVIKNWSIKRKIMSKAATVIAKKGLGINTTDPMSGFFAFKKQIINGLRFDAIGYKMLLEVLVKTRGVVVKDIPYTFSDRRYGISKVDVTTVTDYIKSVWKLYRYGKSARKEERRPSVRFLSKAGRFFTVGAFGIGVNYLISLLFTSGVADLWYLHANLVGIIASISSNFLLNKIWTFEDRDFSAKKTFNQYAMFMVFSSFGALIQIGMVFSLVESYEIIYPLALILAVLTAALSNFILNKKFTFKEKLWG